MFSSSSDVNITTATLYDFNGRAVRTITNNQAYYAVMNVNDLANGMYAIEIKSADGGQAIKKVIVQH